MNPQKLPIDIDTIISQIDRFDNRELLPNSDTIKDKYDATLKGLFPDCQIVNITEFDYGRSYRYLIAMSKDKDAAILNTEALMKAVSKMEHLDMINLAISLLGPYYLLSYTRYTLRGGKLEDRRSDEPFGNDQENIALRLGETLGSYNIRQLDSSIANLLVPDVKTDLREIGEVTVADCLFFG